MKIGNPRALLWVLRHSPTWLGRSGVIGIGLLVLALAVGMARIPAGQERLRHLQKSSVSLHERLQRAAGSFDDAARSPEEQLGNFYAAFPVTRTAPDLLGRIFDAASRHGVTLAQGEYRVKRESGSLLTRYQISLPVTGHYLKVREFLGEALKQNPFLALDNVGFQRGKINEPVIEARIQLSLYLIEAS